MLKRLNTIQTTDTSNLVRKANYDIHSITRKFNKLMKDLGSKNDIADFVEKKNDEKLKKSNKRDTSNETRHREVAKKIDNIA